MTTADPQASCNANAEAQAELSGRTYGKGQVERHSEMGVNIQSGELVTGGHHVISTRTIVKENRKKKALVDAIA